MRLALLLAMVACGCSAKVVAEGPTEKRYALNIPSSAVDTALIALARDTDRSLIIPSKGLSGQRSRALQGVYTLSEALSAMLEGTNLSGGLTNSGVITISPRKTEGQVGEDDMKRGQSRKSLLASVSAFLFGAATAHAQEEVVNAPDRQLEEIVVTAQRVESLASKTPVALTALRGHELFSRGVTNPTGLGDHVPNLSIVRNNGLQITIRGVTSSDNTEKGDPSAALLLDGIYIARPQAQEVSFFDINRVEVLRGPQGTLYGRNTTAGVVNVITNKPIHAFEGAVNVSYGDFDTVQGDAMINVPVNDMVAVRFAGSYDRRDSYLIREPGDANDIEPFKDNRSARVQALFDFNEDLSLLLRGDYSSLQGSGFTTVLGSRYYAPVPAGQPGYTDPEYIGDDYSSKELRRIGYDMATDVEGDDETWGLDAELNWNLGLFALTYLGSYREYERSLTNATITGFGPGTTVSEGDYDQVSQELRFALNDIEGLQAQFGAYYFKEESHNSLVLPGIVGFSQGPTKSESYAFFGQATYSLTDTLRVTAGARYSHDDKSRLGAIFNPATGAIISPNNASITSDKVTWRLAIDHDLDDRSLLYGVVSTGYKAGGFNGGCEDGTPGCVNPRPTELLFYQPEELTAYEVGLKTRFARDRIQFNAAAFYYDYTDLQVSSISEFMGTPQQVTQNAAAADVKGVELEAVITPDDLNQIEVGVTYLDAEYDTYWPLGVGNPPDFSGNPLARAPELVGTAAYTFTYPFRNGSSLAFSARTRLSDEYVIASQTTGQQFRQPSFTRTNVSLTYYAPGERFHIQTFADNLENDIQVNTAGIALGAMVVTPNDPRTYGLRAGVRF